MSACPLQIGLMLRTISFINNYSNKHFCLFTIVFVFFCLNKYIFLIFSIKETILLYNPIHISFILLFHEVQFNTKYEEKTIKQRKNTIKRNYCGIMYIKKKEKKLC